MFGCSDTLTEPIVNEQILSAIYTLPYDQQIDHDAQFISENFINTSGEIKEVIFSVSNFNNDVFFDFFITSDYYDTLYFSPKLSTTAIEEEIFTLNKEFDGLVNVHIFRYETFKPIDFRCEIKYTKN